MRARRVSKDRYVTVCQQLLVTATVTVVGLTAAGVTTLDLVTPQAEPASPAPTPALVEDHPVTPTVHEVSIDSAKRARAAAPSVGERAGVRTTARAVLNRAPRQAPTVAGLRMAVLSPPQPVSGYATVGVTWSPRVHPAADQVAVEVRWEQDGAWSDWKRLGYHDDHGPDAGAEEGRHARPGTDALVVGDVDRVQMRMATSSGAPPPGVRLAVVDPGRDDLVPQPAATDPMATSEGDVSLSAMVNAPRPKIYTRADWGANEKLREQNNTDYGTIKTGFVHHTVNANDYTRGQVPAIIRGIYAYHVISRGWRDIGYNFLIDRFGRIWEGRYGGVNRPVIGAHTYGYNDVSFAASAIGNFDIWDHGLGNPPKAMIHAFAKLFAWKLSRYDIRANDAHVLVKGHDLQAINGHRDVGQTACPGRYLYAKLPAIRKQARQIQLAAQGPPATRVGKSTRYATAAALATRTFDKGISRVYISNGTGFADSISGGVAAALRHAPVLLVKPHEVPPSVVKAMQALAPKSVVILGGTEAVDQQVAQTLKGLTSGAVRRVSGATRYATAASVARRTFPNGVRTAYVASGDSFADALSGVPRAAAAKAPILLTRADALPNATLDALRDLGVDRIKVLGGPAAVSAAVLDRLSRIGTTTRIAGATRYSTNARIADAFSDDPSLTVYLTSGEMFPDALAAGAVAGGQGSPVLLTRPGGLPAATKQALKSLHVAKLVVVGGTAAVSGSVVTAARVAAR